VQNTLARRTGDFQLRPWTSPSWLVTTGGISSQKIRSNSFCFPSQIVTLNLTPRKCFGFRSPIEAFLGELGTLVEK
jgi:hypothetical protein